MQERGLPQKAGVSIAVGPVIGNTTKAYLKYLKKEHAMLHLQVLKVLKLIPLLLLITKHRYWIPDMVLT